MRLMVQYLDLRPVPRLQGHLAHKKLPPPKTLQQVYAQGPTVVLGWGARYCERGTPVPLP